MKQETAASIINAAAVECGLRPTTNDPFASQEDHFIQLTGLLNNAGDELLLYQDWQALNASHTIVTANGDTGTYPLPSDYSHMIPQTGWDNTNRWPMRGPLSPQEWTYLEGRQLNQQTIRVTFRLRERTFQIYPSPPPAGITLTYEYQSRNWVRGPGGNRKDSATQGADTVLFPSLICKFFLKYRYLASKGFDTTQAVAELERSLESVIAKDTSARILNTSGSSGRYPYLDSWRNISDTGYGLDVW